MTPGRQARTADRDDPQDVSDVVDSLISAVGLRLTAHVAGHPPEDVPIWTRGAQRPPRAAEERLRGLYAVVEMLSTVDTTEVVRTWLIAADPDHDGRSPVELIAAGDVRAALALARTFRDS